MANTIQKPLRNQSMEWAKLTASVFVVFIHVKFPREAGEILTCLARFAVPMFFAISGYFNLNATVPQLRRRMGSILRLTLFAVAVHLLWNVCTTEFFNTRELLTFLFRGGRIVTDLLLLQALPYPHCGHLWYLLSLLLCYGVLWGYTLFWRDREISYSWLYLAGAWLFSLYFLCALLLPYEGMAVPYRVYRNGWLTGIPMFLMGMFLREHQDRILDNFRLTGKKLLALVVLGAALSLLQEQSGFRSEIPLGTLLEVPALILLLARYPRIPVSGSWFSVLTAKLGSLSTAVYVLHLLMLDLYERQLLAAMERIFGTREGWLRPLAVVALSLAAGMLWIGLQTLLDRCLKKPRT